MLGVLVWIVVILLICFSVTGWHWIIFYVGEYRGQFDKLNIAMVLVGNRLYYVTFEKIEKL